VNLETLSRDESLALLESVPVGRVVFTVRALPAIQPVNFVYDNGGVVIRTGPGAKLAAVLRNGVVAFEADEIDPATRTGWSVTVIGRVHEITDPFDLDRLRGTLCPWAPGEREHLLKIAAEVVTGRRITEEVPAPHADSAAAPVGTRKLGKRDAPLENGPAPRGRSDGELTT
jgi:hypothetical protein